MKRTGLISRGLLVGLALVLAGCSGGTATRPLWPQLLDATREIIATKRAGRVERPPLTRAALDQLDGAFLEVVVERRDVLAYLFFSAERRDASPGHIIQWRTEDNVSVTFRNGVLIGTRGLGGGVISAQVNVREGKSGPSSGGERALFIRTGDVEERRLALACDLVDLGPANLEIVERFHSVRHLQERCKAAQGGVVTNDYWVDSHRNIMWQSRQWAGPHIGYIRTRRLTE